jgi:exodeoxyribonuclease III
MKIASFNINDVNKRLGNLIGWLRTEKPDVVALQELKAADREFPKAAIEKAGYGAVWRGQKTWNGVAILARGCEPIVTRREFPGDPDDRQARYIEAAVNGVIVTSLYAPNGNPQPGPKFDYKLAWMERLLAHAKELCAAGVPVVLAGDYNVVPTDRDIYAVLQPAPRAQFPETAGAGLARRAPCAASRRRALHLLELSAEPLAARRRAAHRSFAVERAGGEAARRRRRRPRGARRGQRQRPRASLGGVEGGERPPSVLAQAGTRSPLAGSPMLGAPATRPTIFSPRRRRRRSDAGAPCSSPASEKTTILYPVKAGEMARIGPKEVRERYGVAPKQVPDFIALRGDPSDRLPGAAGVGAQGAAALIRQYGSLAALLKTGRFAKQAEDLKLYRSIATMDKKAPLPKVAAQTPSWHKAAALARKWQLSQLADRLEEMARKPRQGEFV